MKYLLDVNVLLAAKHDAKLATFDSGSPTSPLRFALSDQDG